jgi:acyl carrier protein
MKAETRAPQAHEIVRPFGAVGLLEMVEPRVRALVVYDLGVEPADLTLQSSLSDDLAVDSLELLELVVRIEDELDVTVPERAITQMRTYGDLVMVVLGQVVAVMATEGSVPVPFRAVATTPLGSTAIHRTGVLDPYGVGMLVEDAGFLGGRVEVTVPGGTETAVRTMLASLATRGVAVTVVAEKAGRASAAA